MYMGARTTRPQPAPPSGVVPPPSRPVPVLRRAQSEARLGAPHSSLANMYSFGMAAAIQLCALVVEAFTPKYAAILEKNLWLHAGIRPIILLVTVSGAFVNRLPISNAKRKVVVQCLWVAVFTLSSVFYGFWFEIARTYSPISLMRSSFLLYCIILFIVMTIISGLRFVSGVLLAAYGLVGFILASNFSGMYQNPEYMFSDTVNMVVIIMFFTSLGGWMHLHSRALTKEGHERWRLLQSQAKYTMDLSRRILPSVVMNQVELGISDEAKADHFAFQSENCAIVFIQVTFDDEVTPSARSRTKPPIAVPPERFKQLSDVYDKLDKISEAYNAYTVERLHDTYFAVTGLAGSGADDIPTPRSTSDYAASTLHAIDMDADGNMNMNRRGSEITRLESAIQVACGALAVAKLLPSEWGCRIRVGVHAGPVQACVIGNLDNPHFTALGDAVNVGARLMTTCEWGRIQLSADTVALMPDRLHSFEERGAIQVKGVGAIDSFWYRDDPEASASIVRIVTSRPPPESRMPRRVSLNELELGTLGPDFEPESFNKLRTLLPVRGGLLYRFNDKSVEKEFEQYYLPSGASAMAFLALMGSLLAGSQSMMFISADDPYTVILFIVLQPATLLLWFLVMLLRPIRRSPLALKIVYCCGYILLQGATLGLNFTLVQIKMIRDPDDVGLQIMVVSFVCLMFFYRLIPPLNVILSLSCATADVLFTIFYFNDPSAAAVRGVVFFFCISVGFYGNMLLEDAHRRAFWVDYSLRENVKKSTKLLRMSLPDVAVNAVLTKELGTFLDLGWLGLGSSSSPSASPGATPSTTPRAPGAAIGIGLVPLHSARPTPRLAGSRVAPLNLDVGSGGGSASGTGSGIGSRRGITTDASESTSYGSLEGDSYKSEVLHLVQCDIVDFTRMSRLLSVKDIARVVNTLFSEFDGIVSREGAHKLQTAGDSYLVASSRFQKATYGALQAVQIALAMTGTLPGVIATLKSKFGIDVDLRVRVGVATGEGHGGIVGSLKPTFLFFGPVVPLVNTMERSAPPNQVLVCSRTVGILHHNTEIPHVLRILRKTLSSSIAGAVGLGLAARSATTGLSAATGAAGAGAALPPAAGLGLDPTVPPPHANADITVTLSSGPAGSHIIRSLSHQDADVDGIEDGADNKLKSVRPTMAKGWPASSVGDISAAGAGAGAGAGVSGAYPPLAPPAPRDSRVMTLSRSESSVRRHSVEYVKMSAIEEEEAHGDETSIGIQLHGVASGSDVGLGLDVNRTRSTHSTALGYVVSHAPGSKTFTAVEYHIRGGL